MDIPEPYYAALLVMAELMDALVKIISLAQTEIDQLRADVLALENKLKGQNTNPT